MINDHDRAATRHPETLAGVKHALRRVKKPGLRVAMEPFAGTRQRHHQ
jgi:hypothetical protein